MKNRKKILEYLSETNKQTEDMIKVLSEIYRYEAGVKVLNKTDIDVFEVINDVLNGVFAYIKRKGFSVIKDFTAEEHIISADKNEFQRLILLFLTYISERIKSENIKISVYDDNCFLKCCFVVSELQVSGSLNDIIFDRELVSSRLERVVGEGIHLYLAKLIAMAHGGAVYFSENYGKSYEFCIKMPF